VDEAFAEMGFRWARIVAAEPPGRAAGRRPRDPEQERMLRAMDRARLEREHPELLQPVAGDPERTGRP
jgi:hypothetical protein